MNKPRDEEIRKLAGESPLLKEGTAPRTGVTHGSPTPVKSRNSPALRTPPRANSQESGKTERGEHMNYEKRTLHKGWLQSPSEVTLERIAQERNEIARMNKEGDWEEALFREASLLGHVLAATHLGIVPGDVATLCSRRAITITKDNFRLLP